MHPEISEIRNAHAMQSPHTLLYLKKMLEQDAHLV